MRTMVVGMARSGTSFLGELFRQNPDVAYLYEPCWGDTPIRRDQLVWRTERDSWPEGEELVRDIYAGRLDSVCRYQPAPMRPGLFPTRRQELADQLGTLPLPGDARVAVKSVRLNMQLRWLAAGPVEGLRIVHLVRDPRGVVASFLLGGPPPGTWAGLRSSASALVGRAPRGRTMFEHWGWDAETGERRVPEQLAPFVDHLDRGQPHERIAARWALLAGQAMTDSAQIPEQGYLRVRYEDLCLDPLGTAERIYAWLDLRLPSQVTDWLGVNTVGGGRGDRFGTARDSAAMPDVWRRQLGRRQVRDVERLCGQLMHVAGYAT